MKKLLLLTLLLVNTAVAGRDTREIRATNSDGLTGDLSIVRNPGFERGKRFWSESGGTFTTTSTSANVGSGSLAGSWDSSGAAQTLTGTAVAIPAGDYGANYEVSANLQCASGTCTHTLGYYDGTTLLGSQTITSSTSYVRTTLNFVAPSSGTLAVRISSVASNEPILYIDDVYLGRARNIGSVAQARLVGTLKHAGTTNCRWTQTSTSMASFPTDSDCPTPTFTGDLSAPGTKIPAAVLASASNKNYKVTAVFTASSTGGPSACYYELYDGTTSFAGSDTVATNQVTTLVGIFSYTSAASRTFEIRGQRTGGTSCEIFNTVSPNSVNFIVEELPSSSEIAYRPDLLANSWSGYHDTDCQWSTTSSSFVDPTGDSTCTFTETTNNNFGTVTSYLSGSDKLPGIVFTPKLAQSYFVCVGTSTRNSASNQNSIELSDLTPTVVGLHAMNSPGVTNDFYQGVCGIYNATNTSSKTLRVRLKTSGGTLTMNGTGIGRVQWTIYPVSQSLPAPVLVGSVTSLSSGAIRIEAGNIAGSSTNTVACTSSPCTVNNSTSTWLSVNRTSTGLYAGTITSGVFSSTPACFCSKAAGDLDDVVCDISASSSTAFNARIYVPSSNIPQDYAMNVQCIGPRGSL